MTGTSGANGGAGQTIDRAARRAAPWAERVARFGYAAKGVTYLLIGGLSVLTAVGSGGSVGGGGGSEGPRGAIDSLLGQPFGRGIIGLIGLGLLSYAAWQFLRAGLDPEREGRDAKGVGKRLAFVISGLIHLSLALYCASLAAGVLGFGGGGGTEADGEGSRSLSAYVMSWAGGKWLIAAVGLFIVGFGVQQVWKAYRADLDDMLDLSPLAPGVRRAATLVCRFGMAGRGVALALVGAFTFLAGLRANPSEAGGLEVALDALGRYGPVALGVVALGLFAYGVYMLIMSRYRRIRVT